MSGRRSSFFSKYSVPRMVTIHYPCICCLYMLVLLLAIVCTGTFFVLYNKGYLDEVPVESAVTTKLYGIANTGNPDQYIWDNADYMVPPKENGAVTVITSILATLNQTQGVCEESPIVKAGLCQADADCPLNTFVHRGNGERTGKCLNSTIQPGVKVCEIRAWCPVEFDDISKRAHLADENFTISIRNHVKFPKFGINRQNIPNDMDLEEMYECRYDPKHPRYKYCPMFNIGTVVKETGNRFDAVRDEGAVIEIIIHWDCYFFKPYSDECLPTYTFYRLDNQDHLQSKGFHMRFADHYRNKNDGLERTLYRAYGIRVIISVQGKGSRFDIIEAAMNFGSGIGYIQTAGAVFAFVVIWWLKKKKIAPVTEDGWSEEDRSNDDLFEVHVYRPKREDNEHFGLRNAVDYGAASEATT